jgi:predicted GH43/DUF377 family glycosyl hydrolase
VVIWRTDAGIFAPEKQWEKVGQVPNVVFVEGTVRQGERYLFYYGGADTNVGVAEAPILPWKSGKRRSNDIDRSR